MYDVCRHGAQGRLDGASKATLENEFGTANEDEIIKLILEKGTFQETEVSFYWRSLIFSILPSLFPTLLYVTIGSLSGSNILTTKQKYRQESGQAIRTTASDRVVLLIRQIVDSGVRLELLSPAFIVLMPQAHETRTMPRGVVIMKGWNDESIAPGSFAVLSIGAQKSRTVSQFSGVVVQRLSALILSSSR